MDRDSSGSPCDPAHRQMSARSMTGHSSSHRLLVSGILAQTSRVVRDAQSGNWSAVAVASAQRRELLGRLEQQCCPQEHAAVAALGQAIAESEHVLALIGMPPMVTRSGLMLR